MKSEALYTDRDFARFYDTDNPWSEDTEFCLGLARRAATLLDLGCGTGRFCARVAADGPKVICGVDPAAAMLDIARRRPGSGALRWVQGDARTVRLGARFDLIVMTGHAFQTLLTAADRAAALATIAAHLAPGGRFIFDSRNPVARAWEGWTPEGTRQTFEQPGLGLVESWTDAAWDAARGIVAYRTHYDVAVEGRVISAQSQIAFPAQPDLAQAIAAAGLRVERWMGAWDGRAFAPDAPEIIPIGTLAA
jgi:SAM-dependent methyltransferase